MPAVIDQGARPAAAISERRLRRLHSRARRQRAERLLLQRLTRAALAPPLRLLWRPVITGRELLPAEGPLLVAANHRSPLDPLALMVALGRPARFMATSDMFTSLPKALLFSRLGAFPVRRGASDTDAMLTARLLLEAGETVCIFPEGRLVRPADKPHLHATPPANLAAVELGLGLPKRGVGRLSVRTGAPVIPAAMVGTEAPTAATWRRGAEVRVAFAAPILAYEPPHAPDDTQHEAVDDLVHGKLWPQVRQGVSALEIDRRTALAAGAGVGLTAVALVALRIASRARRS